MSGMMKVSDVAKYLNVSEHAVSRWCLDGKIPHYKVGHAVRFERAEFEQWLKDRKRAA